jgi:hypothetical protein
MVPAHRQAIPPFVLHEAVVDDVGSLKDTLVVNVAGSTLYDRRFLSSRPSRQVTTRERSGFGIFITSFGVSSTLGPENTLISRE